MFPFGKSWGKVISFQPTMVLKVLEAKLTFLPEVGAMSSLSSSWITQDAFLNSLPHPQGSHRKGQNTRKSDRTESCVKSAAGRDQRPWRELGWVLCGTAALWSPSGLPAPSLLVFKTAQCWPDFPASITYTVDTLLRSCPLLSRGSLWGLCIEKEKGRRTWRWIENPKEEVLKEHISN